MPAQVVQPISCTLPAAQLTATLGGRCRTKICSGGIEICIVLRLGCEERGGGGSLVSAIKRTKLRIKLQVPNERLVRAHSRW